MALKDIFSFFRKSEKEQPGGSMSDRYGYAKTPTAMNDGASYLGTAAFTEPWNGQNSLGEMGDPVRLLVDYNALMIRSWQLYLESGSYKTILKKLTDTVVGSGLKLESRPNDRYLKKKGIKINAESFTQDLEDLWNLYANSTMSDYAGKDTLGKIHARAYLNSIAAGSVLVILRPTNNVVKIQLVDGIHVQTPMYFPTKSVAEINYNYIERYNPDTNNRVRWGVEIDDAGRHVAYFVRVGIGIDYVRVPARGKRSNNLLAYMLTDEEFRIDDTRTMPRMAQGMETASQLSRYQSAMVSAAEELAKAPYFIKHEQGSSGEDPRLKDIKSAHDVDKPLGSQLNYDAEGKAVANKVSASTNRTVANMPPGSELKALESKNQLHFEPFYKAITESQAALAGIPPEIVASKFDSNFSASRAAFLAEGMRLNREWKHQGDCFLQPILSLQMDIWVRTFELQAPGYLEALENKDEYTLSAYRRCSWEGQKLGHIDPLKEAMYWRLVLGSGSAHMPIGNFEQAADGLALGDFKANMRQYASEMEESDSLGIEHEDAQTANDEKEPDKEAYWRQMMQEAIKLTKE